MDEPMNFAIVEDGVVVNVIWLSASNREDYPNSVCVANRAVAIGDQYIDGAFLRDGLPVPVYTDQIDDLVRQVDELEKAIEMIEEALNG